MLRTRRTRQPESSPSSFQEQDRTRTRPQILHWWRRCASHATALAMVPTACHCPGDGPHRMPLPWRWSPPHAAALAMVRTAGPGSRRRPQPSQLQPQAMAPTAGSGSHSRPQARRWPAGRCGRDRWGRAQKRRRGHSQPRRRWCVGSVIIGAPRRPPPPVRPGAACAPVAAHAQPGSARSAWQRTLSLAAHAPPCPGIAMATGSRGGRRRTPSPCPAARACAPPAPPRAASRRPAAAAAAGRGGRDVAGKPPG